MHFFWKINSRTGTFIREVRVHANNSGYEQGAGFFVCIANAKILEAKSRNRWNAITSQEVELHCLRTALKNFKIGFSCSKTFMS